MDSAAPRQPRAWISMIRFRSRTGTGRTEGHGSHRPPAETADRLRSSATDLQPETRGFSPIWHRGRMLTDVDLPAPGLLWPRWVTLAASLTGIGWPDVWFVDEQ